MADEQKEHKYKIIINGEETITEQHILTYEAVVQLAFPNSDPETIYSITFEKAKQPHAGDLVAGQQVEIKHGTEFDVTPTGKS